MASTFESFATGLGIGKQMKRQRQVEEARSRAGDLFKSGNYEGAEGLLLSTGLGDEAQYFAAAGQRKRDAEQREAYGKAFKDGGYKAVGSAAAERGDFTTAGNMESAAWNRRQQERTEQQWTQEDYRAGMEYLATEAQNLKSVAPEQRLDAAMAAVQNTPFGENQEVIASIQRAGADGMITDEELDNFSMQMASGVERLMMEKEDERYAETVDYRNRRDAIEDRRADRSLDMDAERLDIARQSAEAEAAEANQPSQSPYLEGLPTSVQSAIVNNEMDVLQKSDERVRSLENMATKTQQFNTEAENYTAQGAGWLQDIGQIFSMKTSDLNQITNELVPLMREAGSGPMSDKDAERYESSVTNVNNTRETNERVAQNYAAAVANEKDYNAWLRDWQQRNGYGGQQQAIAIWNQYANDESLFDKDGTPRIADDGSLTRPSIYEWIRLQEIDAELEALEQAGREKLPDGSDVMGAIP